MLKEQILEYAKKNKVFITDDIAKSLNIKKEGRHYLNTVLSRLCKNNAIVRYEKGVYGYVEYSSLFKRHSYIPYENAMMTIYLNDDNGYITGGDFLYAIGLTTWCASKRMIVSNKVAKTHIFKNLIVSPPKEPITTNNLVYLQFLDCIQQMDDFPVDNDNPVKVLMRYIKQKLDIQTLIITAKRLYPKKVLKKLNKIMEDDINETA